MSSDVEIDVNGLTTRITQLENSTKVAFSAFRTYKYTGNEHVGQGDLSFDALELNVGNAFDQWTGVFKAPLPGSYHFTLSAPCKFCKINFLKNDGVDWMIQMEQGAEGSPNKNILAYSLAIDLKEGDEVKIVVAEGELIVAGLEQRYEGNYPINFSGFLI